MMECPECGARNSSDSSFCVRCGTQFSAPGAASSQPPRNGGSSGVLDEAAELYAAGRLDEAAEACHAALDRSPELVAARSMLGMIEEDRGNHAAALAEYEAVLRLAPARTAERERADRLRGLLEASAGPALVEPQGADQRRWIPLVAAIAAAVIVLLLGGLYLSALSNRGRGGAVDLGPQARPHQTSGLAPAAAGTHGATRSLRTHTGPGAGTPIGSMARDQSDRQPSTTTTARSAARSPRRGSVDPIPGLPPPTVGTATGGQPLELPQPSVRVPEPQFTPVAPTGSAPAPTPTPRGRASIWVDDGPTAAQAAAPTHSATAQATRADVSRQPLLPSGPGAQPAGPRVATMSNTPSTRSGRIARATPTTARGASVRGTRVAVRPGATSSTGGRSRPMVSQSGSPGSGPVVVAPAPAAAVSTTTTRSSGQAASRAPSTAGSRGTGPAPQTPADLRARAQRAQASGQRDEARRLYQAAIQSYQADAARNPGRAATSRSAIQSCQRALDTIDIR